MNIAKSLILGSAATLVALGGAQAADLPLKAKAVEYVKVCSLYGAGFYYIPGTDTCIKLGGYVMADTTFNGAGAYNMPRWTGAPTRASNDYISRSRFASTIDTRTATEYGVVRTYASLIYSWTTDTSSRASGELGVYYAFIQFAGFTMGKAVSQFSTPWTGYPGNNTSFLIGGEDDVTGINQLSYTAQFGNGVSAAISLEDPSSYRQGGLYNVTAAPSGAFANIGGVATSITSGSLAAQQFFQGVPGLNSYAGVSVPDIVGQLRVDQAWGLFQLSAAAHQLRASYYATSPSLNEALGHPGDAWGYAVQVGLSLKNLPTGAGDSINFSAGYANGASRYVLGGVSPNNFAMFGSSNVAYQSIAVAASGDGVFANGGSIEKSSIWGVRGAFNHNWDPYWSSSLFGSYTSVDWGAAGSALICGASIGANNVSQSPGTVCNPNFNIAQIGTVLRWTPVKNLTFSGEVMYTFLDQRSSGIVGPASATAPNNNLIGATKPAGATYELKDQGTWTVGVRAQRTF